MKKNVSLIFLVIFSLFSCQGTDEIKPESVTGTWSLDSAVEGETDLVYRDEIIFETDGSFESSVRLLEASSERTVGYLSLLTGRYVLDKGKLYRSEVKQYGLDNEHEWMERDDLVLLSTIDELPVIKISLNEAGNALTLDYTLSGCPDTGNCIDYVVYFKDDGI